ncbi:uncharacterized protein LOC110454116 [Mizuhopecten yessoensis]|uniref:uncharacterized protein LOC110454116 n=1 Tax=Mizuhopecten yessoensis TaxID=6573 RepID=UPI000B459929|nr:uncharacterized protein LOC110454116 [Mizuhopecten yessoensis]
MVNKTKVARMKEREKIAAMLKTAVLSLCQEKYKNPIEVDALICVALTPTDNHVVKIHETLGFFGNKNSGAVTTQDTNGDQNICKVSNIWSMGPKSKRKRKVTNEDMLMNTPAGGDMTAWQAENISKNLSEARTDVSGLEALKNDTPVKKYPYLVQTLCGEDNMYLSSVGKDVLRKGDGENSVAPTQPKEPASVASILSGLMIPMSTASTPLKPIPAAESPNIQVAETSIRRKRKLDRGEIRRASPVTQDNEDDESQDYTSIKEQRDDGLYNQNVSDKEHDSSANNDESNSNQTMSDQTLPGGIVIKEEPIWSTTEDTESKWPTENEENSSEVDNSQTSSTCNTPTQFFQSQPENSDDPMEMSVTSVKEEPQDSDIGEPEMEIDTDIDSSQFDFNRNSDSGSISETTKNSILLKILKGKSLAEAYKSSIPKDRFGSESKEGTSMSNCQPNTGEDQDNSLVYRLPFVSFQDLFPGEVSGEKSQERDNVAVTSPLETSMRVGAALTPTEHANRKFELLTRSLLEKRNRAKGPYSTRLSSGRKNPVNYTEMADVGSDFDVSDGSGSPRSELDDSYSPRLQGMLEDDEEKSRRPRKKGFGRSGSELFAYKQKTYVKDTMESDMALKSEMAKEPRSTSSMTCPPKKQSSSSNLLLFACSICGSEFSSRAERDRHEEEEQYSEFVKCPLCNGYFGDEMSKRKHMRERHKVCEKELNSKTGGSGSSGELRALEVPKFSEGMLTYHTTQCPMCYNFFYSEAERDEHLNKEHNVTPVTQ